MSKAFRNNHLSTIQQFSNNSIEKFSILFAKYHFRLAVHNMHYVSNVLGIRDPIHKQKIALKAMDVVLFGPPRGMCIAIF